MKICWDNLEKIIFSKRTGNFRIGHLTLYEYSCTICGCSFLGRKGSSCCSTECSKKSCIGRQFTHEHKTKLSKNHANVSGENNPMHGKRGCWHGKTRKDHSIKMSGNGNPNWKNGITYEEYCPLWTDREYKDWLKYERDSGKCQNPLCENKSNRLTLHHINYDKKDCRPTNLIAVCNSCNAAANYNREWHAAFYGELIRRKLSSFVQVPGVV